MMNRWMRVMENLRDSKVDPVCAAAAASFGFVYIHPFEDGNGRIHRFLVHQELASSGFTPYQMLFAVSAVMIRDRKRCDEVLERFTQSVSPYIDYDMHQDGSPVVYNQTAHLYKFWTRPRLWNSYMTAWLKSFAPILGRRSDS
jgi:hypothetical protein